MFVVVSVSFGQITSDQIDHITSHHMFLTCHPYHRAATGSTPPYIYASQRVYTSHHTNITGKYYHLLQLAWYKYRSRYRYNRIQQCSLFYEEVTVVVMQLQLVVVDVVELVYCLTAQNINLLQLHVNLSFNQSRRGESRKDSWSYWSYECFKNIFKIYLENNLQSFIGAI